MVTPYDIKSKLLQSFEVQKLIKKIDKALMEEDNIKDYPVRVEIKIPHTYPSFVESLVAKIYVEMGWAKVETDYYVYTEKDGNSAIPYLGSKFTFYF